jgi:hypothetical protein
VIGPVVSGKGWSRVQEYWAPEFADVVQRMEVSINLYRKQKIFQELVLVYQCLKNCLENGLYVRANDRDWKFFSEIGSNPVNRGCLASCEPLSRE